MAAKRVLVTGGAGFIGSHMVTALLARGDHVTVIDDLSTGSERNVSFAGVTVVKASVADSSAIDNVFDSFRPDVTVHAAGSYKDPDAWNKDVNTNTLGTVNVLRASERVGVRRLVYFQTALCYGIRPLALPIKLDHPLMPASSYAISKVAGEQYVRLSALDYVSLRIPNVYGPRGVAGPLAAFVNRLTKRQRCTVVKAFRDFVFIDDLLTLILAVVDGDGPSGHYHVGSGTERSIQELYELTTAALAMDPIAPPNVIACPSDDVVSNVLDVSETERIFGWKASTPLEVGVPRAVEHYKAHGISNSYSHLRLNQPT